MNHPLATLCLIVGALAFAATGLMAWRTTTQLFQDQGFQEARTAAARAGIGWGASVIVAVLAVISAVSA